MTYKLPEEWEEVELGEIFEYRSGLSKGRKYFGTGYPYLSFKEVFNNYFLPGELTELVETTDRERKNMSIEEGDVFLTRTSETFDELGMSSVALKDYKDSTFNGFTKRLRPKIKEVLYPKFSGYYFRSKKFRDQVDSISTMTTRASLNNSMLDILKIVIPPLPEQKVIAETLSSIDDKIENNNKINENLEEQAQAIFKHWFVDFEFPDQEGNPYKSSGGEMVESELGMIPKGWEVRKIKDISKDIVLGKTPRTSDKDNFGGDIPFLTIPDMHNKVYVDNTQRTLSEKGVNTQVNKTVPENSICVSCIATPGLVTITKGPTQTNQQINTIIPNIKYTYVYSYMKSISNKIISLGSGGTTTNNLNKTQFSNIDIIVPFKEKLISYHNLIEKTFELIKINQTQNQKLAQLRDTLLPKLMSGEIRIPLD